MSDAMNPIQAAEDVLARFPSGIATWKQTEILAAALSALLTHARTLDAELLRLREPLGDHKELVEQLSAFSDKHKTITYSTDFAKRVAAYIERQAAKLARKTAVVGALTTLSSAPVDVKVDGLAAAVIDLAETHPKLDGAQRRGLKITAQMLRTLSRQLTTERQAWAKVQAEIEAEIGGPDLSRSDGLRKALAILSQHAQPPGG